MAFDDQVTRLKQENPTVDESELRRGLDAIRAFDSLGFESEPGYRIIPPFSPRPITRPGHAKGKFPRR